MLFILAVNIERIHCNSLKNDGFDKMPRIMIKQQIEWMIENLFNEFWESFNVWEMIVCYTLPGF